MKKIFYAALINVLIALLGIPALQAQTTDGTDFWLTFGVNNSQTYSAATLQIRVVSRDKPTVVQINFTQLGTTVTYPLAPWEVKTHTLSSQEKQAVYNTATGKSNKSIYIHSDYAITAYAINQCQTSTDATNIFPEPALDIEYYHISYTRADSYQDAYAVIATENNTNVYHEGTLLPNMPLNRGDVYFRRDVPDMTGSHILADKPVAFFAMNERVMIPTNYEARDHLFQQLAPVNTWGKNFFVPVTHIGTDRVRIVASQPGTTVTRTGGIHAYAPGGQLGPTYTLNPGPGQYIELEVNLTGKGCYIVADKPIGVCNYLTSYSYAGSVLSDPAQCWLPPTEQMATQALLAQFTIPPYLGYTPLHYALIVTPDATKNNTTVSIGSGTPVPLFGGTWTTNTTTPPGMDPIAFYTFPLTSSSDSYEFSNDAELFALGYGTGYAESYYYLGYASMRKLDAFFTANDVHNQDMDNTLFCENEIIFHAEIAITGAEIVALKWYINNVEHLPAQNQEDWTGTFAAGDYVIKLEIYPDQGDIVVLEGILHIGAHITVAADPPEGGTAEEDGCYQVGETAVVRATPNECWEFVNWTENDIVVPGANENYSFTVTKDRHLVAHFQKINYTVTVTVDPPNSGTVTGDGNKPCGENVSLLATAEDCFDFVAWIEDDKPVTSDNPYEFKLEGDRTLVALFEQRFYDVTVSVDPSGSGTVTGDGKNKPCGENVSLLAIPEECFEFVGWTEGGKPVTTDNPYEFILEEDRDLVANFETTSGDVTLLIEPPGSGTVTGDGKDFPCDEPVTITATPEECYYFVNWTDEDDNEVSPLDEYTFIMNKSVTWTANFAKYYYDVNVTADPQKGGTITGDGKNIECGETITLTVEEDECYTFIGWTEDGDPVSTANPYIFTLEGDRNLVAHFELKLFDVVVSADPPEGGTVGGGETNFPCGEYITVTAAPDPCYYFVNWTEDDKEVSTSTTYSFEVKDHHTLVANFEIYTYNVTVSASPVAGGIVTIISPDDSGTYNCGEDITVSVEIDPCYNFDGWTDNGKPVGNNDPTYTIVGIDEDHVIVAHFTIKTFTVDVSADPPAGGIVSPNGIETYDCGDDVTVTVKVDDCYTFLGWTDNGDDVGDDLSYTITGIDDDHIVIAHFVLKYFDIIISADPPEGGTVDGGELDFPCGEFITVTAEAEECYYFVNWTEDGDEVSKSEEYTFEVKDHHTLVANFAMYYYDVLVSANPVEGGDVDGGGNHIECGTEITVTAEADDCYTFINWTEDGDEVSTNPIYTFDLFEDRDLVANFDIIPYVLNLSANPIEGSVTGAGTYDCGDWVSAEAFPTDCYTFVEWIDGNGNFVSTDNPYKFFILHETTLEAIFAIKEYTVSVSENPAIGGDATIITQPNANNAYDCDTDVTVTADPDPCYNFVNWTEDGNIVSTNPTYTIEEIDADHTLVANFVIKTFTVDVSADPPAGGIVTGTGTYDCGDNVTVTVEVDECYTFLGWTDNGVNVGNNLSYTITDIDDDHTVIAHFEIILYDVILSANPPEPIGGTVSGGGLDIECGTEITIVATPDDCYTFVNWTEGSTVISTDDFYTFEVKKSWNLVANFQIKKFNVTVSADPEEGGDVFGGVTNIDCNTEITVWAEEDYCYTFINWTEDGDEVSDQLSYTFDLTADRDLVANFELKYFTISVIIDPPGSGTVTGDGVYPCYDYVELVATPDSCHYFVSWTDENNIVVHPDSAYAFIATGDRTLTANFERKTITIVTIPDPAPGGMTNGNFIVPCGTLVTLEAYPNPEYDFVDWTYEDGTIASTNNPYIFTATEDLVLTANFVLKAYQILVYANPNIGGNSVGGGGIYSHYDVITVHAYAGDCYDFIQWTDEFGVWVSDDPDYTFTVTGPRILVADFYLKNYVIITVSDPPTGGVTYGDGSYDCHELVTVIAEPIDCYDFAGWEDENGDIVSYDFSYEFYADSSQILIAHFELMTFNVDVSANPPNGGTATILTPPNSDGTYTCYESVEIMAEPDECYDFVNWTKDNVIVSNNPSYIFTVTENCTFIANFVRQTFNIIVAADPAAGGDVFGGGTYNCGDTATVWAILNPNGCYYFVGWEDENGTIVSNDIFYSFEVYGHHILTAIFEYNTFTVNVSANPTGGGDVSVSGSGAYICGENVTVEAEPNECFDFIGWTKDGVWVLPNNLSYTFTVTGNHTLIANFERKTYHIILYADPSDGGYVYGAGDYPCDSMATLIAEPEYCYEFVEWQENGVFVSDDNPYEFPVLGHHTLTAIFEPIPFTINVSANPTGAGTVTTDNGTGIYLCYETATVTAEPDYCYEFVNWTENGVVVSTDVSYTFTVLKDRNLIANFQLQQFNVILNVDPVGKGTVDQSGSGVYDCFEDVYVWAYPDPEGCYEFVGWWENGVFVSDDNPYIILAIDEHHTLTAHFEPQEFTITVLPNPDFGGTASITTPGPYLCEEFVTVEAIPNECYQFVNWTENGIEVSTNPLYTFIVLNDRTLIANFEIMTYHVVLLADPQGSGTVHQINNDGVYDCDDEVFIWADPDDCYEFEGWYENGVLVSPNNQYKFIIHENHILTAHFVLRTVTITVLADPDNGGTVTGDGTYTCNDPVTVTAVADDCYTFINWTVNGEVVFANPYTFTVRESLTLIAHFEIKTFNIFVSATPMNGGTAHQSGDGVYDCGDEVQIWAIPNDCYEFVEWTDNGVWYSDDISFTIDEVYGNHNFVAHFALKALDIIVLANPPFGGAVFGGGTYYCYDNVTLTAIPDSCFKFVSWTKDGEIVLTNPYTFTVTEPGIYIANFEIIYYAVIAIPSPSQGGDIIGNGDGIHECGEELSLYADPAECYEFVNWTDLDGTIVSTDPLYKFIVGDNLILFANFEVKTFQITVLPNPPNGGTVSGGGIYDCKETAIVKAFPEPCYTFVNWTLNGVVVSWDAFYAFDVEESCTLIANFELSYFDVIVSADPGGIAGTTEMHIACGEPRTVSAIANTGYHFTNWTDDNGYVSDLPQYSFIVDKSYNFVAHFEKDAYDILLLANPPQGAISLIGAGTYDAGDNITVEAIADPCYTFIEWTENGVPVCLTPQYPFTVTKSRTLVANFEIILYDVALSVDPPDTGEVTGGGTGLPCGDDITITAIPDECYTFVEWTEGGVFVSDENPYTFVLEEDRDIVAHFTIRYCNITVSADPAVGDNAVSDNLYGILCGETVTVTAVADPCFTFLYWTEDGVIVSYDADYTFEVLEDRDLVANFAQKTFAITLLRNPPAGGTVEGGGNQLCDDIITVTAIPDECYTFINWTEDGVPVCYTLDYEFKVTEPRTLVANFEQKTFNVTVFANPPLGGTVLQNYTDVPCGDPVIVIAIPAEGYQFDNWTENGVPVSTLDHYPFDITSSRVLVANFIIKSFEIIVLADPPIGGTVTGGGFYDNNEEATVKATPNPHYMFINWTENGMPVSPDSIYTFTVTQSRTLVAYFDSIFYTVITDVNDPNYGFTEGDGVYGEDESVTVVATTTSCYRFAHWTIDDDIVSLDPIYTFTVTKDVTVVANFYALDFDTYAPTLWNNTFMLNLRKLAEEHYIVTGCIWYKNGNIEPTTRTIDEFSYSAGPAITDLLELAPTWYMFELLTSSHGPLCSTHKALDYNPLSNPPSGDLVIYPNPVISGNTFTVEGVVEGCTVQVFNQYGMCVRSVIATKNPITLTLSNVQPGTYVIQANGKEGKVVVIP